jgi:cellulose synthase/poly-beta-1,6-N-acetylglucosamine synthase-like glycosyltransferase
VLAAKIIFWLSVALVFYTYAGYPLLLWILQSVFRRPVNKSPIEPSVSLLISAYNEAHVIGEKVRNSLLLDYPADKLEIVVASDGSSDDTARITRQIAEHEGAGRVRLLEFIENRGKVTALNDAIPELKGDIVVFSDASSMLAADAVRKLVANFADVRVGAASGVYQVLNKHTSTLGHQEDFYWKYETFLKLQESKIGALAGAHGSLYGMRRALYPFPPAGTINDDFVIPTSVLKSGLRIAYEPAAVAYEEAHEMAGFGRRVRIMAGNIDQMREVRGLLWPPRLIPLFCFLSHKGTRIVVPLAMLAAFLSNAYLWHAAMYQWIFWMQIAFYGSALLGALGILRWKILKLPYYFCMINASLFAWIYYRLTGRLRPTSARSGRPGVVWT